MKYEYKEDNILLHGRKGGKILIDIKETPSTYIIKTLEFSLHYPIGEIEVLKNGLKVQKHRSPHCITKDDNYFVIYPYRNGTPFVFKAVEDILFKEVDK